MNPLKRFPQQPAPLFAAQVIYLLVALLLALLLGLLTAGAAWAEPTTCDPCADESLPVVEEHYDCILVITDPAYDNIVFIRGNCVVTRRTWESSGWIWSQKKSGEIVVIFEDYWTAHRIITADELWHIHVDHDPELDPGGPWWNQGRNMRDFQAP